MNITENIVIDLLPLYHSGEASEDTQALVAEYLQQHPQFARIVEAAQQVRLPAEEALSPSEATEMHALARTRQQLQRRNFLLGMAFFFTAWIVAFRFDSSGFYWQWQEQPNMALAFGILAAVTWTAYFLQRNRLRSLGI